MAAQTPQQPDPVVLYRKIAKIAGAIGRVEKDGYNPQLKYRYPSPATIMEAVKPLLTEHQIAIVPQISQVVKEPTGSKTQSGAEKVLTRVEMTFLLLDGESGATLAVPWVGEGEDWSDKGIAKAQTIAMRTFLINLFQIPSGDDDPDAGQQQRAASYDRPAAPTQRLPQPANGAKSPPSRVELEQRIADILAEAREAKATIPAAPKAINVMTDAELIQHGKNIRAAIGMAEAANIRKAAGEQVI